METKAATSYTNAKEFYESTGSYGKPYHAEMVNGTIYYATKAKLAASSTNLRYHTVGFDISLSGNGHTVSFTVQRTGGSMTEVNSKKDSTHEYILYAVEDDKLFELATKADPTNAAYVLEASVIRVKMDAILTTKKGNSLYGGITENGSGGFTSWGSIYRLKDSANLLEMKNAFQGHTFESYCNIQEELQNHLLSIRYNVNGTDNIVNTSSTTATVSSGYTNNNGILYKNGSTFLTTARVIQQVQLLSQSDIGLAKTGYHLDDGKEWITSEGSIYSSAITYMPKDISSEIGYKDKGVTMYANWQPNTYTVSYDANGGVGTVASTGHTYDIEDSLRKNTFIRSGYELVEGEEWNTKPDGSGTSYSSTEVVKNLSSINDENVVLYANWKSASVKITMDKQGGSGGADTFFQRYGVGFFSDADTKNSIQGISIPSLKGYRFLGYFMNRLGAGSPLIDTDGKILTESTYYTKNTTIYASYEKEEYQIIFDKQGGTGGDDSVTAVYEEYVPDAVAPIWTGYTFQGYYTKPNGGGEMYYNEFMVSDRIYQIEGDLTLYAYWEDNSAPEITLSVSCETWTNQKVTLTANAYDFGSGLSSVKIYRIEEDGQTLVREVVNLNGISSTEISFENTKEGIIRYKAVATDMSGESAEYYNVVYYDITAPAGEVLEAEINGNTFYFDIEVTDINPGN